MRVLDKKDLSRRAALEMLGAFGAAIVVGCGSDSEGAGGSGGEAGSGGSTSSTGTNSTGTNSTGTNSTTTSTNTGDWATGDGSFLTGKDYGNPFASGVGATCAVWKAATLGPCHSNTYHRQDISEGVVGLPTRLEIMVVDAACNPVPDAIVEVWHCSPDGVYSAAPTAETSDIGYDANHASDLNGGMCTGNNATAQQAAWGRGYQKAGADGRVTFDTVFPGWYGGRTVHVHFKVTVGTTEYIVSQFFFEDTLNDEIIADHAEYSARGAKDTTNAADKVVSEAGLTLSSVVMSAAKQSDGALLAWKAITINA